MDAFRQQQYLKAMGITAWLPRDAESPQQQAVVATAPAPSLIAPAESAQLQTATPSATTQLEMANAAQLAPGAYTDHLADATVDVLAARADDLLLVIESPALTSADNELLGKMLAAIGLDLNAQGIAYQSTPGTGSVGTVARELAPKVIVAMVGCQGDASRIAPHRAQYYQPVWTNALVVVTHHPADLNSQPDLKRPAWEDLKRVKSLLDNQHPA